MGAPELPPDLIGLSGLYKTSDPLLRRLRFEDTTGHPITEVAKYFRDKKVLIFYAGSEAGSQNLKSLHQSLTALVLSRIRTCAIIYVSTDTSPSAPARVLRDQPWCRLVFEDNSDFAPMAEPALAGRSGSAKEREVEMEEVSRGEEFIQAGEIETGMEKVELGKEEYEHDYVRPLSRAALTALMTAYATPSLAVYNTETHQFVAKNVRIQEFSSNRIDKNYSTWLNGGTPSIQLMDLATALRWPLALALLTILYHVSIYAGLVQADFIPQFIHKLGWRSTT